MVMSGNPKDDPETRKLDSDRGIKDEYRYFRRRVHEEVLRSQRCSHPFTLMRLSIDPLDRERGIREIEPLLKSAIREYDLLCSTGQAEYYLAFPETNDHNAEIIADRIRDRVRGERWTDASTLSLEASIGIACFPYDGNNTEDLFESADQDLRQIRNRRRN